MVLWRLAALRCSNRVEIRCMACFNIPRKYDFRGFTTRSFPQNYEKRFHGSTSFFLRITCHIECRSHANGGGKGLKLVP